MLRFLVAVPAVLALSLPAFAEGPEYKKFDNKIFSLDVPSDWKVIKESQEKIGLWKWASPQGGFALRVRVKPLTADNFAKRAERGIEQFVSRGKNAQVLKKDHVQADGRDVYYAFVRSHRTLKGNTKEYLSFRLITYSRTAKIFVAITVSATAEKEPLFMPLVDRVMSTIKFADAEPAAAAQQKK